MRMRPDKGYQAALQAARDPMQVLGVRALQPTADRLSLGELPLRRNRRRLRAGGRILLALLVLAALLVLGAGR